MSEFLASIDATSFVIGVIAGVIFGLGGLALTSLLNDN